MNTQSRKHMSLLLVMPAIALMTYCGAPNIVRQYGQSGELQSTKVTKGGGRDYTLIFEYDGAGRLSSAKKVRLSAGKPTSVRTFTYDQAGRLRIATGKSLIMRDGKEVEDSWVESYFFGRTGLLEKSQTSFKSSYSISINRTPLVTVRYHYKAGTLDRISIDGGIFRKEAALTWKGEKAYELDFKDQGPEREGGALKLKRHVVFTCKKDAPTGARDMLAGRTMDDREMKKLFRAEKLPDYTQKHRYAIETSRIAPITEEQWLR